MVEDMAKFFPNFQPQPFPGLDRDGDLLPRVSSGVPHGGYPMQHNPCALPPLLGAVPYYSARRAWLALPPCRPASRAPRMRWGLIRSATHWTDHPSYVTIFSLL